MCTFEKENNKLSKMKKTRSASIMKRAFSYLIALVELAITLVVFIGSRVVEAFNVMLSLFYYFEEIQKCPAIKDEIILLPAFVLADKIRRKELTSESLVRAYVNRIKEVNPVLNAVVEDRYDAAIKEAQQIDDRLSKTNLTKNQLEDQFPLLGVPITIKESIAVKGMSHAAGNVFSYDKRAFKDAEVVTLCKKAGAIPLAVTNTPELCVHFETYNKVTGRTRNPYDTRRTPGGSSGGEGALLGAGASVIGLGSDIYGSVRLPAHYCCIFGHKPSPNTVSVEGHYPDCRNEKEWNAIFNIGPMCRYATDLQLLMKVISKESYASVLKLNQEVDLSNIKVYYMEDDNGSMLTHPVDLEIITGIRRIISHMAKRHGCQTQKLKMKEFKYSALVSLTKLFSVDDIDPISGDEFPSTEIIRYLTYRSKFFIGPIISALATNVWGYAPNAITNHIKKLETHFKTRLHETLGSDGVLIYPCLPKAAPVHNQAYGRFFDYSYSGIFNSLGMPATSCPLGLNSEGLPIGVQVVAAPNNDRLTLAVAREMEIVFGGWTPPPFKNL